MAKKINWLQIVVLVLITELAGFISSFLSGNVREIYAVLMKPPLSPPAWLFGVVWPMLYMLMAIAVYIIYQTPNTSKKKSLILLYWIQLFINFTWSIIFFRFQWFVFSIAIIVLLDLLVLFITVKYAKINKTAGSLLIPYLLWILFATYLNIGIAILN